MKTTKLAAMIVALALAPAAFAGGFGSINVPGGRFREAGTAATSEPKMTYPSLSTNFYAPSHQTRAGQWRITPYWWGYPFGFAISNKD